MAFLLFIERSKEKRRRGITKKWTEQVNRLNANFQLLAWLTFVFFLRYISRIFIVQFFNGVKYTFSWIVSTAADEKITGKKEIYYDLMTGKPNEIEWGNSFLGAIQNPPFFHCFAGNQIGRRVKKKNKRWIRWARVFPNAEAPLSFTLWTIHLRNIFLQGDRKPRYGWIERKRHCTRGWTCLIFNLKGFPLKAIRMSFQFNVLMTNDAGIRWQCETNDLYIILVQFLFSSFFLLGGCQALKPE